VKRRARAPDVVYVLELAGEDDPFAAREAATAASGVRRVGVGLAVADAVDRIRVRRLAFTHRASDLLIRCRPLVTAAEEALRAASLDRSGSVAVRARNVRGSTDVDTRRVERVLGAVLVDRGFSVDLDEPDHELGVLFAGAPPAGPVTDDEVGVVDDGAVCLLGWRYVESERGYGDRRPTDRPFFQPGSMDPLLARVLVNLAGAGPGTRLLDPMCGTGGVLIEAGLVGADVLGVDAQEKMIRGTRRNLTAYLDADETDTTVLRGDATRLPFADGTVDGVVFDAPYGRQSAVAGTGPRTLAAGALREARRVADRGVVVADQEYTAAAEDAGWRVTGRYPRRVHRSLVRHVHVLEKAN
jgi:tRNA (guanine10-N2)-dimethyltransferase